MKATELIEKLQGLIDIYGDSDTICNFVTYENDIDMEVNNITVSDNYMTRKFIIEE